MGQYRSHEPETIAMVVLGQPLEEASKVTLDYKAPVAALIMVLMIAAMVFDFIPIPPVAAVIIAGILMVLTGCFVTWKRLIKRLIGKA